MRFRWQAGGYEESMASVVEVSDLIALTWAIRSRFPLTDTNPEDIELRFYGTDHRNGWETYLVLVKGQPVGYTDGRFPPDLRRKEGEFLDANTQREALFPRSAHHEREYPGDDSAPFQRSAIPSDPEAIYTALYDFLSGAAQSRASAPIQAAFERSDTAEGQRLILEKLEAKG